MKQTQAAPAPPESEGRCPQESNRQPIGGAWEGTAPRSQLARAGRAWTAPAGESTAKGHSADATPSASRGGRL